MGVPFGNTSGIIDGKRYTETLRDVVYAYSNVKDSTNTWVVQGGDKRGEALSKVVQPNRESRVDSHTDKLFVLLISHNVLVDDESYRACNYRLSIFALKIIHIDACIILKVFHIII